MELKSLNKIIVLLALIISVKAFSQMKMAQVEGRKFQLIQKQKNEIL